MARATKALEAWGDLFDPAYMDHACEAIAEAGRTWFRPDAMAATIRAHLLRPLDAYMADHYRPGRSQTANVAAALELHSAAATLATELERGSDGRAAAAMVPGLRLAWLEFIAHGAGPMVYDGLMKARAQRRAAAKEPRGAAAELTPEALAQRMKAKGLASLSQELAQAIGDEYGVSDRTVYRRLARAQALGLLPEREAD